MRAATARRRPSPAALALAAPAAAALALALRGVAGAPLAALGAAALLAALGRARSRTEAFLAAALAASGVTAVAALAVAPLSPLGYVAAAVLLALPFGLVGLAHHEAARRAPRLAVLAPLLLWPATEALLGRPALFGSWAMPVASLAYALVDTPLLPLAAPLGVPGLSLLVLALGAAALEATRRPLAGAASVAALASTGLAAAAALAPAGPPDRLLPVRIVQPARSPQEIAAARLDPVLADAHAAALQTASRAPDRLVVWPEGILPAPIEHPLRDGRPAALPGGVPVLLGAATRRDGATFNSALLWRPGRLDLVVDKRRLVPFTEAALAPGLWRPPTAWRGERLGVLICWEAAFPALARRAAAEGATLLVVLADDAYAAEGPVPELHLRVARLRAAEARLPLVFASQTGPSAVVDGAGRVVDRLGRGVADVLDVDVPLGSASRRPRRAAPGSAPIDATPSGRAPRPPDPLRPAPGRG